MKNYHGVSTTFLRIQSVQMARTDCPACLKKLLEPRTLPCGHMYCLGCLEMMQTKKNRVQCHICKGIHTVTLEIVDGRKVCIFTARTRNLGQGNFLHLSVILFTGGCLPHCIHTPYGQTHTPREDTPLRQKPPTGQTPPRQTQPPPPWADTLPWRDTPPGKTPSDRHLPLGQTPPRQTHSHPLGYYGVWTTSKRYASYLNAYLLLSYISHDDKFSHCNQKKNINVSANVHNV